MEALIQDSSQIIETGKEEVTQSTKKTTAKKVRGFVFTDKLKIRNSPSIESETIGALEFGDEIIYFGISGTSIYKDGILDKWVNISDTEEKWVNYLYVIPFNTPLNMSCLDNIIRNNESALNVYDELPNRIFIKDIEIRDSKKYFKFSLSDDSYYHKEDYQFEKEVEPVIKNIYPASFQKALKRGAGGKIFRKVDDEYEDMTSGNYVMFPPKNATYDPEKDLYIVNDNKPIKTIEDLDTLIILDNPSFRKFQFCEYIFRNYGGVTKIKEDNEVLEYGIKVGMPIEDLYEILGEPVYVNGEILDYFGSDRKDTMELFISTKNGKISSINYEYYK